MKDYSINNTTKAQREQKVRECLGYSDISCEEGPTRGDCGYI